MKLQFIYPTDPMSQNLVDAHFRPQNNLLILRTYGHPALFSLEDNWVKHVIPGVTVVYRGWMLDIAEYQRLKTLVEAAGATLLTSLGQYLNTHHLPNWYPLLREFTPETFIIDNLWLNHGCDLVTQLKQLGWEKFFLKDFVKSLKTAGGSVINTPEDAPKVVELMEKYRGTIEGGLCVRRFEPLYDEIRYFIVDNHIWSPQFRAIDYDLVLRFITGRIDSQFYSADVALNNNGKPRLVEIGDGQVSDLVGWTPEFFCTIFKDLERP